jgi:uncharacterized membrane protein
MISAQTIMYSLGAFFILAAIYLVVILIVRKSIWNYPPVVSMYINFILFLLFSSIVLIKQIEITDTVRILIFVAMIIWSFITLRLPARKEVQNVGKDPQEQK